MPVEGETKLLDFFVVTKKCFLSRSRPGSFFRLAGWKLEAGSRTWILVKISCVIPVVYPYFSLDDGSRR